jgi:hypothetical protein
MVVSVLAATEKKKPDRSERSYGPMERNPGMGISLTSSADSASDVKNTRTGTSITHPVEVSLLNASLAIMFQLLKVGSDVSLVYLLKSIIGC